ncbi:Uncharacterised protein [uncultured archaeon]|nr:Uncharacterised protein [uncultured archaeon]
MAIGLGDIYEKLKELVTITDKVRENTERIAKLEEKVDTLHIDMIDIKAILNQLKTEEKIDALESIVREHIAACEKANA